MRSAAAAVAATGCCGTDGTPARRAGSGRGHRDGTTGFAAAFAVLRRKVGAVFGGDTEQLSSAAQSVENRPWLRVSSRCQGSMTRLAEPALSRGSDADAAEAESWDGFCSVCKRPLSIALTAPPAKRSRHSVAKGERCAFVIALWGTSPEYVLGAMVLGWSLRKTQTRHDLVLVHTSDVSSEAVALLQRAGWKPREVDHVPASANLSNDGCSEMRFAKVFTKLRVLQLVEYSKILMMDIDLLVKDNIDELFDLPAPVALVRGPEVGYEHGERICGSYFFSGTRDDGYSWGQSSGINAGVMLLRPDEAVFQQMFSEVVDDRHPGHIRGNGPEQDYLSRFYAGDWRHLSVAYNFQLHQMYFALSPVCSATADRTKFLFQPDLIKVIHYSSEPKPWSRFLEESFAKYSEEEWVTEVLQSFSGYRAWVMKELDQIRREANRSSDLVVGPDGNLHKIDWSKVKSRKWGEGDRVEIKPSQAASTIENDVAPEASIEKENQDTSNDALVESGQCTSRDECGLMSEDGWPLGEPLLVPEALIQAAENTLRLTQDLWFKAFHELADDLGETDLASVVKAATTGPMIREEWDWSAGEAVRGEQIDDSSNIKYASTWTQDGTGGWWVQGPIVGRCVATCSTLPQKQATLIVDGSVVLAANCDGVHVAAVSKTAAVVCPSPQSLSPGPSGIAAASAWAESVPEGATVLLASIDPTSEQVNGILHALVAAGLGCPSAMPSECSVAAAVGQKGANKWYTTHAAADVAFATSSSPHGEGSSDGT